MCFKFGKKVGALVLALIMVTGLFAVTPVMAEDDGVEIILKDVTESNANTKTKEAKIQISVKGDVSNLTSMQAVLDFTGDLDYKPTVYCLVDADTVVDNGEAANAKNEVSVGFALNNSINISGETPVFIVTFKGEPGDTATVTVDKDRSYCVSGSKKILTTNQSSITVTAAANAKEGTDATVKVVMNKVPGFIATNESGITLKITDRSTGEIIKTILNNDNRDSGTEARFTITNTVIKGNTYDVELYGLGYQTYEAENVSFDADGFVLTIDNSMFVPGDINKDGEITSADKTLYESIIAEDEYNAAADFNRDGYVDEKDNVFGDIESEKNTPSKMSKPSLSGGAKKMTVSWTAPSNGGSEITGYVIKYGTSSSNLDKTKEITNASATSDVITGLNADTTYYVQIAAKNAVGMSPYSDMANVKTNAESEGAGGGGGGGGGGGAGGGGGGGGAGGGGAATPVVKPEETPTETQPEEEKPSQPEVTVKEVFTDLGNYAWAKDSIYSLKDKGIISGVSETEYAPANNIRRGDFILILTRMLSINDSFTENFADVPVSSYYYNAIGSAKAAGIASGDGANFMPEKTITRQDLITLAYRAFLAKGYITETDDMSSLDEFLDKDTISDYAKTAMASMVKAGIIKGANGCVNPRGNATRAEVAVMCARLMELIK